MKHLLYTLILVATLLSLSGCGAERAVRKGDKHQALGEYYDAAVQYRKAYRQLSPKERQRGKVALKMARCYERINQSQRANSAYANALRYGQAGLEDRLAYGRQLLKSASYKEAADMFRTVLDSMPDNELAKSGLQSALNAPAIKQAGSRYKVKRMDVFNSRRADYSPVLAGDALDHLYFSSTRNEAEGDELSGITGTKNADIFVSVKDDKGKWSKPEPVSGGLNTAYDEGACCISPDGREMYLTQCVTDPSSPRYAEIVTSNRSDAAWSKPTKLELTRDTLSSYAHPAISPDGEWLYFVSDMPGGKGGMDIWRVRITSVGLGGVENLGEPINTPGDEMFPTFRPNGDLYFSSNGHPGLGGLDIFIAKVNKQGRYQLYHPGYPLNSHGDDFGMTFEGPHNRGYFSSNRGDGRGWDHIYAFENPEVVNTVKGWVYEAEGYELPQAEVYMVGNDGTNRRLTLKSDGSFTQVVKPGVSYVMLATCKGFLNHKEELTVRPTEESEETVLQFPLVSITAPVLIDNIFYDFDKATLRPESTKALDELVTLLNENGNVTIERPLRLQGQRRVQQAALAAPRRGCGRLSHRQGHSPRSAHARRLRQGEAQDHTAQAHRAAHVAQGGRRADRRVYQPSGQGQAGDSQPAEPPHRVYRAAHHLRTVRRARQTQEETQACHHRQARGRRRAEHHHRVAPHHRAHTAGA